jgi:hypothetical protein
MILNVGLSVIPILQLTEFRDIVPKDYITWYALMVAVLNIWMRSITTTAVGKK